MNQEVEIRVILKDPQNAKEKIEKLGRFIKSRKQTDKYYVPKDKDYFEQKQVIEYLRVRYEDGTNHLNYSYCNLENDGTLISTDEYEVPIEKPEVAEEILQKIGMVLKITVNKERVYYSVENFEVTIDHIAELGYFMEIEAKNDFGGVGKTKDACYELLNSLNIEYRKSPNMGYPNMVLEKMKNPNFLP